jgi:hypothetical protein
VQLGDEGAAASDGSLIGGSEDRESLCEGTSSEGSNDGKGLHDVESTGRLDVY